MDAVETLRLVLALVGAGAAFAAGFAARGARRASKAATRHADRAEAWSLVAELYRLARQSDADARNAWCASPPDPQRARGYEALATRLRLEASNAAGSLKAGAEPALERAYLEALVVGVKPHGERG